MAVKIKCLTFVCALFLSPNVFASSTSIDIVRTTSDSLSVSLETAIKQQVTHSRDFALNNNGKSDVQVVIAEPLKLKKLANSTQVFYKVNLLYRQNILGVSSGSCWQEQISQCADQVLRDAKLNLPNR